MKAIATRIYDLDGFPCSDTLFRSDLETFPLLLVCEGHPDEPHEQWKTYSTSQAREWLNEAPEQFVQTSACVVLRIKP